MKKWEYQRVHCWTNEWQTKIWMNRLNELGNEGWELVETYWDGDTVYLLVKREKAN